MKKRTIPIVAAVLSGALLLAGCSQTADGGNQADGSQGGAALAFEDTDSELAQIVERFTQKVNDDSENLTAEQKHLISIVSLVVQQSEGMLEQETQDALSGGVSPEAIREAVYQCAPYVGLPRAVDALETVNAVFVENGIELPLPSQGTVDEDTRFDLGLDAQAGIYGDGMRRIAEGGEEAMARSSFYLVDNCFGDYYTREGLDLETREMLTLAILVNLGTESQISSHVTGNANLGRSREFISDVIYQCLPYAGYPRILNALNCLNAVLPQETEDEAKAAGTTGIESAAAMEAEGTIFAQGDPNPMGGLFYRADLSGSIADER